MFTYHHQLHALHHILLTGSWLSFQCLNLGTHTYARTDLGYSQGYVNIVPGCTLVVYRANQGWLPTGDLQCPPASPVFSMLVDQNMGCAPKHTYPTEKTQPICPILMLENLTTVKFPFKFYNHWYVYAWIRCQFLWLFCPFEVHSYMTATYTIFTSTTNWIYRSRKQLYIH